MPKLEVERHYAEGRTFSQALGPHVCEFFLVHRCEIFRITPYIVLQNRTSSSCTRNYELLK